MKKLLAKKLQTEKLEVYRGIRLWQGWAGQYSYTMKADQKVMILLPLIEGYAPDFTQAKKWVDAWYESNQYRKYKHERKHSELGF